VVHGDAAALLPQLPEAGVDLFFTSPPYADARAYSRIHPDRYVEWFLPFANQIRRALTDDGSFVLNIGGSWNKGTPTRSVYHFKLLIALIETVGFHLAQECFWYNPAKMPVPAEWVTVRRIRVRDSVEYVWWLSKTPWPKASNLGVLKGYSPDMLRLAKNGVRQTVRPSGHVITDTFDKINAGGAIPPNVVEEKVTEAESMMKLGNNAANDSYTMRCREAGIKIHPARFPSALPIFFTKMLTQANDLVVDPFTGSNTSGAVAESLDRRWLGFDEVEEYLRASRFRFDLKQKPLF